MKCHMCGETAEINFHKNTKSRCKNCTKIYKKSYIAHNKEKIKQQDIDYRKNNKNYLLNKQRDYRAANPEMILDKAREYRDRTRENRRKTKREYERRKHQEIGYRLKSNISTSVRALLKGRKNNLPILKFLPYSIDCLKKHLEAQFESWMAWNNYGKYNSKIWDDNNPATWTWQIDHIIPHSIFKYSSMEDQLFRDCWALNNLRPYSAKQNLLDGTSRVRH